MAHKIYLNDQVISEENAKIEISDRGFLLSDGLFETIRCEQGKPVRFDQHWQRMNKGCETLGLPNPLQQERAQAVIEQLLKENQLETDHASVRITLTRGTGPRGLAPPKPIKPTLVIQCFPIPEKKQASISLMHSEITLNERSPLRQFKSLAYAENVLAKQAAIAAGYDDALLYNSKGHLVSATSANIFLLIDDCLITPPLSSGALPGTMRQHILERAKSQGIKTSEENLSQKECENAQSAFISNSIIQITPAHQIANQTLTPVHNVYKHLI